MMVREDQCHVKVMGEEVMPGDDGGYQACQECKYESRSIEQV